MKKLNLTKVKGFLNTNPIGKQLTSAVIGSVKSVPVLGNIVTELQANKLDELSGEGKINYTRLGAYVLTAALIVGRIVSPETVNMDLILTILRFVF